ADVLRVGYVEVLRRTRVPQAELVERPDPVAEPLPRHEDRAADVVAEGVVLERGPVAVAHQEADQPLVGLVEPLLAAGGGGAGGGCGRQGGRPPPPPGGRNPGGGRGRPAAGGGPPGPPPGGATSDAPPLRCAPRLRAPASTPKAPPPPHFLPHPASRFDTVELNTTGYRLPSEDQFRRWAEAVPDAFTFAPKLALTRLDRVPVFAERVAVLGDRLG